MIELPQNLHFFIQSLSFESKLMNIWAIEVFINLFVYYAQDV